MGSSKYSRPVPFCLMEQIDLSLTFQRWWLWRTFRVTLGTAQSFVAEAPKETIKSDHGSNVVHAEVGAGLLINLGQNEGEK